MELKLGQMKLGQCLAAPIPGFEYAEVVELPSFSWSDIKAALKKSIASSDFISRLKIGEWNLTDTSSSHGSSYAEAKLMLKAEILGQKDGPKTLHATVISQLGMKRSGIRVQVQYGVI